LGGSTRMGKKGQQPGKVLQEGPKGPGQEKKKPSEKKRTPRRTMGKLKRGKNSEEKGEPVQKREKGYRRAWLGLSSGSSKKLW